MKCRLLFFIVFLIGFSSTAFAQRVGVQTNLLYWATTTPNIGLDIRLGDQTSLTLQGGFNDFQFPSKRTVNEASVNPKLKHWLVMPELKYWFCRTFERGYLGIHGIYTDYNIGGISFIPALSSHRYRGEGYGGGLSLGYQWAFGDRWGVETSIGAGYVRLLYRQFDCGACGDYIGQFRRDYVGPTKAALSIIYYIK